MIKPLLTGVLLVVSLNAYADFGERERWAVLGHSVRLYVNAPAQVDAARPTSLVLYATPNGNTVEQTLGGATGEGIDWHYDIQHILAQVRRWRELNGRENVVLAVAQAPKLSWPAFRLGTPDANGIIRSVVEEAKRGLGGSSVKIVLTGHSGGGSFIFGYINGADAIPAEVVRIAFLDANYSYVDPTAKHGDKLLAWLGGDAGRRLVVVAYDDREIALNGKKVVGPEGGTFRATNRMLARFRKDREILERRAGLFSHYVDAGGRAQFFVHPNPENKILHTALVGEMNGLLHALALGTPDEEKWGAFGGPRAYERWVGKPLWATMPSRPAGAASGSVFAKQIEALSPTDREEAIRREIVQGNFPNFLRSFTPVKSELTGKDGKAHTAIYFITPDYLAVGEDADFFRVPMTPMTAQAIADVFGCALMTRKMSDDVYARATIKLEPRPLTVAREAAKTFFEHHAIIEAQRSAAEAARNTPRDALVAGIKKDVVVTNRLSEKPERVAIYGWHKTDGAPIQPLTIVHKATYVDYSHGVRLVSRRVMVDGREMDIGTVMKDAELSALLSDEGPITAEYPRAPIAAPAE